MTNILQMPVSASPAPNDSDLERMLLASIIADNSVLDKIGGLQPEMLFDPTHAAIMAAALDLRKDDRPVNLVTLKPRFGAIPFAGGGTVFDYLKRFEFAGNLPKISDVADSLMELHLRRDMQALGERLAGSVWDQGTGPGILLSDVSRDIDGLLARSRPAGVTQWNMTDGVDDFMDSMLADKSDKIIPTGFQDLDKLTGGWRRGEYTLLAGRPSMGKAGRITTPVLRSDGTWTPMGGLVVGDGLASWDGRPSRVIAIHPQGKKKIYRVTFKDGRATECCADHLWRVKYRDWPAPRVLATSKIIEMLGRIRYRGRLSIDLVSGDFGVDVALPLDPYLLGTLIANGSFVSGAPAFATPYGNIVERVGTSLPDGVTMRSLGKISWGLRGSGAVGGNAVTNALRQMNLFGCRAESKFIPAAYLSASRETRRLLLQGLIDGDGWVEKFGAMRYGTSSRRLAEDVQTLARSLGGVSVISSRSPRYIHKGVKHAGLPSWVVNMSFPDSREFVSVPQKLERAKPMKSAYLSITSIEPVGVDEAVCISVSHPDQLYVANDYIVTHNSALAVCLARRAAKAGHGVAVFSLEMSKDHWIARTVADMAWTNNDPVSFSDALKGGLNDHHLRRFGDAAKILKALPLVIEEQAGLTVAQIAAKTRQIAQMMSRNGTRLGLVLVDHIGKVKPTPRYKGNRVLETGETSAGLFNLAKSENIAMLALSQLNRGVEGRDNKRPGLADLRDSGDLEQDADMVLFPYRASYYLERMKEDDSDKEATRQEELEKVGNILELQIAKQRNGPTATVELYAEMSANAIRSKWVGTR